MDWVRYQGFTLLFLRLVTAAIFLWHGYGKTDFQIASDKFVNMGFPGFLGPIVGWAEVILGITLLLGFLTRWSSLGLLVIIVVAFFGVQVPANVNWINDNEGFRIFAGPERDLMIWAALMVLAAFGPGILAIDKESKAATE